LTTLYSFCAETNCVDGAEPVAALVEGTDGNFYGTTSGGGLNCPNFQIGGAVFRITLAGSLTTLYSFCQLSNCADGGGPLGAVFQATDGNFYSTTVGDGTAFDGTVFSLSVGLPPFVEALPVSGSVGATVIILGTDLTGTRLSPLMVRLRDSLWFRLPKSNCGPDRCDYRVGRGNDTCRYTPEQRVVPGAVISWSKQVRTTATKT